MKWGVVVACAYEVGAITTGKAPTITVLCGRHRWLGPAVLGALALHLYRKPRPQVIVVPVTGDGCLLCPEPS